MAGQFDAIRERNGTRRRHVFMLLLSLLGLLFIGVVGALLMVDALHFDRRLAASATGVLSLVALGLWLRIVRHRWLLLRIQGAPAIPANEETGIWGVGGPGMRNPTVTGIHVLPSPTRRSSDTSSSSSDSYRPR
jgi:hypothetical protein